MLDFFLLSFVWCRKVEAKSSRTCFDCRSLEEVEEEEKEEMERLPLARGTSDQRHYTGRDAAGSGTLNSGTLIAL